MNKKFKKSVSLVLSMLIVGSFVPTIYAGGGDGESSTTANTSGENPGYIRRKRPVRIDPSELKSEKKEKEQEKEEKMEIENAQPAFAPIVIKRFEAKPYPTVDPKDEILIETKEFSFFRYRV